MGKIRNLYKNIKYLLRNRLEKQDFLRLSYEDVLENCLYYMPNTDVPRPDMYDVSETLKLLVDTDLSIARYGDGELMIIEGKNIPFQEYDKNLAQRLEDILRNTNDNLLVGIPYVYFYAKYDALLNDSEKSYRWYSIPKLRRNLLSYIDLSTKYCSAEISTLISGSDELYKSFRRIWQDKKIAVVTCKSVWDGVKYNIFDNAKEIQNIWVSNKHAWAENDRVLSEVQKLSKDTLVILMCGPAATVWADDLSKLGYRALDIGHVLKGYDFYMKALPQTAENVNKFYAPD